MDSTHVIRDAMAKVSSLRQLATEKPLLAQSVGEVKMFQTRRFVSTYPDLLSSPTFAACTEFFLKELYSTRDFSARDAQFARIAGAMELTFPQPVIATAVTLAELHSLTETLDFAMAEAWCDATTDDEQTRYARAWHKVGTRAERLWQLNTVLTIGNTLSVLTQKRGLYLMLKMMRRPAELAGMASLQIFLESGFKKFSVVARNPKDLAYFLNTIKARESAWIDQMYGLAA